MISADEIARMVTQPNMPAFPIIVQSFGPAMVDSTGQLDRRKMREQVFGSREKLQALEAITHPFMKKEADRQKNQYFVDHDLAFFDCAILLQADLISGIDKIVSVITSDEICIQRLMIRDQIDRDLAQKILDKQLSSEFLTENSDYWIKNDSDYKVFYRAIDRFLGEMLPTL